MFGTKVPNSPNRLVTQEDVDGYVAQMDAFIADAEKRSGDDSLFKKDRQDLKGAPLTWTNRVTVKQLEKLLGVWKDGILKRAPME